MRNAEHRSTIQCKKNLANNGIEVRTVAGLGTTLIMEQQIYLLLRNFVQSHIVIDHPYKINLPSLLEAWEYYRMSILFKLPLIFLILLDLVLGPKVTHQPVSGCFSHTVSHCYFLQYPFSFRRHTVNKSGGFFPIEIHRHSARVQNTLAFKLHSRSLPRGYRK